VKIEFSEIHKSIVDQCRIGDRHAQKQLYQIYSKAMFNSSLRVLQNTQEAEDILQESFIEIFSKIGTFRGDSSVGAWMKSIVVNKSINRLKKKKIEFEELGIDRDMADEVEAGEASDEPEYTVADVKKALSMLSPGYRVVLSLYLFDDYSHKEIAEKLGVTESTSKTQYRRGKERLRKYLIEGGTNEKG
jgi:RNA polymerase sigma factor (sigma-70 family)